MPRKQAHELTRDQARPISAYWCDVIALIVCIGALALAVGIGHFHKIGTFGVETDFYGTYAPQAMGILEHRSYLLERNNSPGYVYLLTAVSLVVGDPFLGGKILSAFATALFGWITYLLFKALFGSRIALVSTLLLLISLIPYSFVAGPDVVGAVLAMVPLVILLRRSLLTLRTCFLSGLLAGFAYFVRNPNLFVIIGIGFCLLFINIDQETVRRRLVGIGYFIAGVLLTTLPWLIVSWRLNDSPVSNLAYLQIAAHFYLGSQAGIDIRSLANQFHSLSDVLWHDPGLIVRKYITGVLYWNLKGLFSALKFPAYLFAGAGFLFLIGDLARNSDNLARRRLTFCLVLFFGYLVLGLVGFILRYYLFLFPFLFLLVAYFLCRESVWTELGRIPFTRTSYGFAVVFVVVVFLSREAYQASKVTVASEPRYLIAMAEFLRRRALPSDVIIDRKPHLAYLSGLNRKLVVSAQNPDEWLKTARKIGARYIVYSDLYESSWPGIKSLRDPTVLPGNFRVIYGHKPTNTLIYEIDGSPDSSVK